MRTFGFANVLLGISVIVTGCEKHLTLVAPLGN
jgi:hypothetical protein